MNAVKQFYNQLQFPGHYSAQSFELQCEYITNPYLDLIDQQLGDNIQVLDVGCGTGLISNLFARRYSSSKFTGIDFANSVEYARLFAKQQQICNVQFEQIDFADFQTREKFDVVICQGVLHHMLDVDSASTKLAELVRPGGKLIVGLYHPWGKILKQFVKIDYKNSILHQDQEHHPHETSYSFDQVKRLFPGLCFKTAYPYTVNMFIALPSFFNYRNGGLVTYVLEKPL